VPASHTPELVRFFVSRRASYSHMCLACVRGGKLAGPEPALSLEGGCLSATADASRSPTPRLNINIMSTDINSGDESLDNRVRDWLRWTPHESEDAEAVKKLMTEGHWPTLRAIMGKPLTFGTAGIRAKMGPGFSQMNDLVIIQTSQGLAQYVINEIGQDEVPVQRCHSALHHVCRF